ncbi:nucleoside hydrolase [Acidobacteriia bacterium AH_259_A11_L15]|nr:nucleoside hydrolase [Acidobacteriia bacterium AH_259_A11_L15]
MRPVLGAHREGKLQDGGFGRRRLFCAVWLAGLFLVLGQPGAAEPARKVILDTDPGTDDAMAILLALNSPELDVQAITVVAGNVLLEQGTENALKVVSLAERCDVPVAAGARRPLAQRLTTAEIWHGANGLGNVEVEPPKCEVDPRFGPDLIIELVHRQPGEITLVPVGPLTNIALAVLKDPSIVALVKEVVLMGGSVSGGNVTPAAEFNIYNDPEAAQIVFAAGWRVTMVGLDVTNRTLFRREHLAELARTQGRQNDFAVGVLTHLVSLSEEHGFGGASMHDPLAVGVTIDRTLVSTQAMRVEVETRGERTRGETVANRQLIVERRSLRGDRYVVTEIERVEPNAEVCIGVEAERFIRLFLSRLRGK